MRQIFPFLELPYEVRRDIYSLALDYPDLDPIFVRIDSQTSEEGEDVASSPPRCVIPAPHVPARLKITPGIMLCNRQTAWEAQEAMRSKTFTLQRPPPSPGTLARPMDITEFISEETLQGVRRIHFIMDLYSDEPKAWLKTIETLLDVWSVETHLREIDITLRQPPGPPSSLAAVRAGQLHFDFFGVRMLSMVQNFAEAAGIPLTGSPLPPPRAMR